MIAHAPRILIPTGPLVPCAASEELFPWLPASDVKKLKDLLSRPFRERLNILMMAGSLANFASKALQDLLWGKTAYAGPTTIYGALYTAAIDDTLAGNTANEAAYTSYARLSLTNNTTIFAAGTGTSTYTKTFPSDATKSWPTSTGGSATVTYMGFLDGNAGTSGDNGLAWCSVTSTTINSGDTPQLAQNAVTVVQD